MKMNTHVEHRTHFGVLILDTEIPNFSAHRLALIEVFQKLRAEDTSEMLRSNQGGWHSLDNLHLSTDPEIHCYVLMHRAFAVWRRRFQRQNLNEWPLGEY